MAPVALSAKAVGSIVKLKVGGTARNFIVTHKGKPSADYDDSCDGVWLLMEDIYEIQQWHSRNVNDYAASTIHSYLNSTFLGLFDADIQAQIKQVKLPYRPGSGYSMTVNSGANGLSAKIFLLSPKEVNMTSYSIPVVGAKLDYFNGCSDTKEDTKRVAKVNSSLNSSLNGLAYSWWLRCPYCYNDGGAPRIVNVSVGGSVVCCEITAQYGIRPALILPSSLLVSDDGTVNTNTAPTTPASITIPNSVEGGASITVTWSAATDAENNLEGYVVERSTDGGVTWTQVYQGSAITTNNTVPAGSETVMYRVKAYDSAGLYSGYRNSAQVSVFNNNAPGAPGGIAVPENVLGGTSLTVTWSAASDVDGNLTGYELERQVNGGEWAQIYKGANTSYTDDITRGWASVNYRVRAYDAYNATSAYVTGTAQPVNNNRAPAFTCDKATGTDLGKKSAGFSVVYSVGDEDDDPVTVTEAIDGVTLRTFSANLGGNNTFAVTGDTFFKLLNGAHTLTATATDGQATTTHKLTFTKKVTAATITLAEPMEADDIISICVLSVAGDIPADADLTVEVTNNANDDTPVWEDCTVEVRNGGNHIFTNESAANGFAFNFRVSVERGPSGQGGFINSVQGGFQ